MKKFAQLGVRWGPEVKDKWEQFSQQRFKKDSSTLAREVLEEFMACFLTDGELFALGLANLTGTRPGGLLSSAQRMVNSPSGLDEADYRQRYAAEVKKEVHDKAQKQAQADSGRTSETTRAQGRKAGTAGLHKTS